MRGSNACTNESLKGFRSKYVTMIIESLHHFQNVTILERTSQSDVIKFLYFLFFRIQTRHAEVYCDGRSTFIKPFSDAAIVLINGTKVREKTALRHLVNTLQ